MNTTGAPPAAGLPPAPVTATQPRRLYRSSDGRVLAGVARGLADHLGIDVLFVRIAFIVLTAASGAGVVAYALFWVFAPQNPFEGDQARNRERDLPMLLALSALGVGFNPHLAVPLLLVCVGVAILWRQADDDARKRWREAAGTSRLSGAVRVAGGVVLLLVGLGALLAGPANLGGTAGGLVATLVVVAGLALVSAPRWLRMARDLAA